MIKTNVLLKWGNMGDFSKISKWGDPLPPIFALKGKSWGWSEREVAHHLKGGRVIKKARVKSDRNTMLHKILYKLLFKNLISWTITLSVTGPTETRGWDHPLEKELEANICKVFSLRTLKTFF